jgi:hypothetical protein
MATDQEIRNFIKTIENDLQNYSYAKLTEETNKYFGRLPIPIVECDNSLFYFHQREYSGKNIIYRGRPLDNPQNIPFPKVANMSYRPENEWKNIDYFGRVSKPGEANFYGSLNPETASFECVFKDEQFRSGNMTHIAMGVWMIIAPLKLVQIPYSEKYWKQFYKLVNFKSRAITEEAIIKANLNAKKELNSEIGFEILTFFADAFANFNITSERDYYLSNYYADRVFNKVTGFSFDNDVDGILYPSVANSYQNLNIVLRPDTVRTKLKFIQGDHYIVTNRIKEDGGSVTWLPLRIRRYPDKDGNIIWDPKHD